MSVTMDKSIKRWTAKRKSALVVEIIQGKTTVAEDSPSFGLSSSLFTGTKRTTASRIASASAPSFF